MWQLDGVSVTDAQGTRNYDHAASVLDPVVRERTQALLDGRGVERINLAHYWQEHGQLPQLDWGTLAAFAAIAGAGGMTNSLFSNYARDKGWAWERTSERYPVPSVAETSGSLMWDVCSR